MANATWLPTMPQTFSSVGFQSGYFDNVNETTPTAGIGSSNPIYSAVPGMIVGSMPVDVGQLTAFEVWYKETLGWGCVPFDGLQHPETHAPCTMKFYKGQGGRHYTKQHVSGRRWTLTMSLAILPEVAS